MSEPLSINLDEIKNVAHGLTFNNELDAQDDLSPGTRADKAMQIENLLKKSSQETIDGLKNLFEAKPDHLYQQELDAENRTKKMVRYLNKRVEKEKSQTDDPFYKLLKSGQHGREMDVTQMLDSVPIEKLEEYLEELSPEQID